MARLTDNLDMNKAVDRDIQPQTKQMSIYIHVGLKYQEGIVATSSAINTFCYFSELDNENN